ncbi:hydrocephalus-inducing protein-like [Phaenicophaeus curvirostris]|uniref:hydrocephalus-inducing protein-like n=1 Tax=Phaenicophaeus curvirostris TaxID=33595 RepID=UPI0037F0E1FD
MATGRSHQPVGLPKRADGFQSEVAASHDRKRGRRAEKPLTVSTDQPTPSAVMKEKSLTTKQRPARTQEAKLPRITQLRDFSAADQQKSFFQAFPAELVFQNFIAPEVYEKAVVLRNNDKVPRLVKVTTEISPYFKLVNHDLAWHKVPPGRTATFHILFIPEENKDYLHELICITERGEFIVPIRAIGARAILDFPAHLDFSICPVNYSTRKTLLIRNVCSREARYRISTQSPFSVDPSIGNLGIGEATQVTVEFHPRKTGNHSRSLVVHYDTGEGIHTRLYGSAVDASIELEKGSVTIKKTYLTLASRGSVVLRNQSEITAHFQWKAAVPREQEDQQKLSWVAIAILFLLLRLHLLHMQPSSSPSEMSPAGYSRPEDGRGKGGHQLCRGFQKQREKVQGDSLLFSSDVFTIDPVEGDVLPNSSVEINVIFKPQEARVYEQTVYCDISGREARLPLHIKAEGIGPKLWFSNEQLDIGDVSVGWARSCEVFLFNEGDIDGAFSLIPPSTALGSCFTFHPQKGIVSPHGFQVIKISFSSTTLGKFTEEFRFRVNGSAEPLTLTIGCVVPLLRALNPVVTFGQCFLEVPYQQMVTLVNDSDLPGCYRILPQEYKDATAVQYSSLVPCGIIQPHGWVQIPFTLQTRVMGEQDTVARVMTIGREGSPLEIHLVSFGEGPVVCVHPSKIDFGSIQVLQDVSQTLHLSNQSPTPASFWAEMAGKCSCWRIEPSKGVIPPNAELPVAVTANLDDTEIFNDEVKVFIENSCSYVIPVQAVGTGITIVTDKPIVPELNLGPRFSKIPFCYRFKVTNKGRKTHLLYWTTEGFSTFQQHHCLDALSTTEGKDSSQNPKSACPTFKLRSLSMELMPGKSMEMVVEGFSSTPQVVKERLLWHAGVGSKEEKVQVMQVDVTCEFIAPVLQLSSTELIFRVEKDLQESFCSSGNTNAEALHN